MCDLYSVTKPQAAIRNLAKAMVSANLLLLLVLTACSPAKQTTFLTIQLCLGDKQNFDTFMATMQSVSNSAHMKFIDGSADTKRDLAALGTTQRGPIIFIGIDDNDGYNLMMGGNLGLPGYQVALGFGEGKKPGEGHALAVEVVKRLKAHWQVLTVPAGKGAFPLASCGLVK